MELRVVVLFSVKWRFKWDIFKNLELDYINSLIIMTTRVDLDLLYDLFCSECLVIHSYILLPFFFENGDHFRNNGSQFTKVPLNLIESQIGVIEYLNIHLQLCTNSVKLVNSLLHE